MNCQEATELMQRHVDADLDEQETAHMMEHVRSCPECQTMLERLTALSKGLEQLPRVVPPYSLVDAILPELGKLDAAGAEAAAEQPAYLAPRGRRTKRAGRYWIGSLSGVAAVAVVVLFLLVNGPGLSLRDDSAQKEAAVPMAGQQDRLAAGTAEAGDAAAALSVPMAYDEAAASEESPAAKKAPAAEPSSAPAAAAEGGGSNANAGFGNAVTAAPSAAPPVMTDKPVVTTGSTGDQTDAVSEGLAVSPGSEAADDHSKMSIAGDLTPPAEELLSPDGQWKAVLTADGVMRVYRTSDAKLVFGPTTEAGKISRLAWAEDSASLDYTYADASGNETNRTLRVPDFTESER